MHPDGKRFGHHMHKLLRPCRCGAKSLLCNRELGQCCSNRLGRLRLRPCEFRIEELTHHDRLYQHEVGRRWSNRPASEMTGLWRVGDGHEGRGWDDAGRATGWRRGGGPKARVWQRADCFGHGYRSISLCYLALRWSSRDLLPPKNAEVAEETWVEPTSGHSKQLRPPWLQFKTIATTMVAIKINCDQHGRK